MYTYSEVNRVEFCAQIYGKHVFLSSEIENGTCEPLFSYLGDRVCSSSSGAGKFCLVHGLRQFTRDVKHDVRTLNFRSDVTSAPSRKTPNDVLKMSLRDVKCQK